MCVCVRVPVRGRIICVCMSATNVEIEKNRWLVGWLVIFYGRSSFVDYLSKILLIDVYFHSNCLLITIFKQACVQLFAHS